MKVQATICQRPLGPVYDLTIVTDDGRVGEFCCARLGDMWQDSYPRLVYAHDKWDVQEGETHRGMAIHYQEPNYGEPEDCYLFIAFCPFCGEKIEVVEEGQESPVSKVVKE